MSQNQKPKKTFPQIQTKADPPRKYPRTLNLSFDQERIIEVIDKVGELRLTGYTELFRRLWDLYGVHMTKYGIHHAGITPPDKKGPRR